MLLRNIKTLNVDSAIIGQKKLDNYYVTKKPKKRKPARVAKGFYGGSGGCGL